MANISVVINTLNEERNIGRAIQSVKWAAEVVVCDMYSEDNTVKIAKSLGAKVIYHKKTNFVEPARNFAISNTSNDWILVLDADEEIPNSLGKKLRELTNKDSQFTYFEIPRKNIIFGKWMKASMWWPDYNIRFFKKGSVSWEGVKIHRPPKTEGEGLKLSADEDMAIIHHHYDTVSQFVERMNRYTTIQAKELFDQGEEFRWRDLIKRPLGEFLGRFFANRGLEDGLHGLSLSILQAFSSLVMHLKLWEMHKFKDDRISLAEVRRIQEKSGKEIGYWIRYSILPKNPLKRFLQKIKNKVR